MSINLINSYSSFNDDLVSVKKTYGRILLHHQSKEIELKILTNLIKLITIIHRDRTDTDEINLDNKGLLQQTASDEGKTLISRLTTAFLALYGYAVDIVSSKRDSVMHGEQTSCSFFQLLKLESGDDDDVNYQLYRQKLNGPQSSIVYREIGAFQRDIFESEF
ncbi:unnamed protein product [Rotaria sp. Silwood1]|nr:unnamed protein product [Rotaria sp. Silwood1]CAF5014114.1 unnamed protein product [Rotaria sp. Silwood1]